MVEPAYYFSYTPMNIAPEAAAAIFIGFAVALALQTVKSRGPRWLLILSVTAFCEAVGYAFRTVCIYWTTLGTFTTMSLFLLLPPNALALTNYKTLGEVVKSAHQSPRNGFSTPRAEPPKSIFLRPRFITWFFFTSDVFSFLLQGAGVGISTQEDKRTLAKQTILTGLAVQLFFFAAFLCIAAYVYFDQRFTVARGPKDVDSREAKRRLFRVIISTTLLLYLRSVYRVAEFVGGYGSKVYGTEWLFYLFDTVMVMVSFALYMQSFIGYHFQSHDSDPKDGAQVGMPLHPPNTSGDVDFVELCPFTTPAIVGDIELDFMAKAARAAAITIHSQLQELRPYLLLQHALDIPDFTLNISSAFHVVCTTVATTDNVVDGDTVTYQSLSMASRPKIVSFIRDKIVYLGQTRRRFVGVSANTTLNYLSPVEQAELVRFSDPVNEISLDEEGIQNLPPSCSTIINPAMADRLELIIISGPRQIGKSHIMLQVAALFASEPSVVVLYVGACGDLVLNGGDSDRAKYIQFIEHVVCACAAYPDVSRVADRWYRATRMGTDLGSMGVATTVFMRELSDMCAERNITIILFLDEYESVIDIDPLLAVVNIRILIERLGIVVVATSSTSDSAFSSSHTNPIRHFCHQCTVTAVLQREEAMNVFLATYGHLDISDTGLERIFEAVEYHPLDIVRTLSQYENKRALLGNVDESIVLGSLISDALFTRNLRISQMHLRYLRDTLIAKARGKELKHDGMAREVISVEQSPQLLKVKREIMRAVFAIYHGLDTKHCSARDLQFAEPDASPMANVRCFPAAAAEIMYQAHFSGCSADEQFQWLFDKVRTKFDVEPRVRLRYFDTLVLESGHIRGAAHRLDKSSGGMLDIRFVHLASFTGNAGQRVEPRLCMTFAQAAEVVAKFVKVQQAKPPTYEPVSSHREIRSSGAMLYFPRLGFNEPWMPADVRSNSHYEGSFMVAVVRVDRLLDDKVEWGTSEFEVTWVANDPLSPSIGQNSSGSGSQPVGKQVPELFAFASNVGPPKDMTDFDSTFGVGGSWAAKALRIFPEIQRLCAEQLGNMSKVRILAVTADERYNEIVTGDLARVLGSDKADGIRDTSVMGISSLGQQVYSQLLAHI
ncbi:hypothetical protein GGI03_000087 [Coemansia sp. RSA 2337]|nr:hypothetical protein GGI14_001738 [Coemansia sp. S680]KAJ2041268.1 hypothetical protein H4S03_000470 [Coemansia sp. S3946]KAJ2098301.1 hypothetical protein GGI09_003386 [Coemansia sp. S100]KAJ2469791.1 hypothetical protein GGI03_000087 [Coemansia sp. RSA 2337]